MRIKRGAQQAPPLYPAEKLLKLHGKWPKIREKWVCTLSIEKERPLNSEILYPPLITSHFGQILEFDSPRKFLHSLHHYALLYRGEHGTSFLSAAFHWKCFQSGSAFKKPGHTGPLLWCRPGVNIYSGVSIPI